MKIPLTGPPPCNLAATRISTRLIGWSSHRLAPAQTAAWCVRARRAGVDVGGRCRPVCLLTGADTAAGRATVGRVAADPVRPRRSQPGVTLALAWTPPLIGGRARPPPPGWLRPG